MSACGSPDAGTVAALEYGFLIFNAATRAHVPTSVPHTEPMLRAIRLTALSGSILFAHGLNAQLSFGGRPLGADSRRNALPPAAVVELPAVDMTALLAEDAHNDASGRKGPFRFGLEHTTDIRMDDAGTWSVLKNGTRVWRVELHCPQALGVGVIFSEYIVPEGAHVFLYNAHGKVLGGYTAMSNPGHHVLGVQPLPGDRVTVEYQEPTMVAGRGHLIIGTVVHVYRGAPGLDRDFGDSGACNVNTICPEGDDWRPEIRSVACIIAGGGYCSGTLLNNCNNDSIPYFLTANHCLEAPSPPDTWVFRFNWESPVCDPTENAPTDHTVSGSTQLVANPGSDMLFLQLNSQPPPEFDVTYSGWDATGTIPDSTVCIHHPRGDIKKITHDNDAAAQINIDVGNGPADCWHAFAYESGTTEPGSSGSALWNQDHRIIGQLYGGTASCSNNVDDYYGRFDVSYPLLTQWLGECDTLNGLDPGYTEPTIPHNAAITSIANVPANVCNDTLIAPLVTLKNNGTAFLQEVTIAYGIIGGASASTTWSGNLAPQQTANVPLPPIAILDGPQTLVVQSTSPNNLPDGDPTDDSFSLDLVAANPGETVTLDLTPDDFGVDITWELTNENGTVLYSGGPYTNGNTNTIIREFCLGNACYTFTIADEFGDGICCGNGNGHYEITSAFGTHVQSNGDYGDGESREFCLEGVGLPESTSGQLMVYPNPTTGEVNMLLPAGLSRTAPWELNDLMGRRILSGSIGKGLQRATIDLGGLANGSYTLRCRMHEVWSVGTLVLQR